MARAFSADEKKRIEKRLRKEGEKLFYVQGLKKTSIDQIVAAAGISKGSFYTFYRSKEDLYIELLMAEEEKKELELEKWLQGPCTSATFISFIQRLFPGEGERSLLPGFVMRNEWTVLYHRAGEPVMAQSFDDDLAFAKRMIAGVKKKGNTPRIEALDLVSLFYGMFYCYIHDNEPRGFSAVGVIRYLAEKISEDLGLK